MRRSVYGASKLKDTWSADQYLKFARFRDRPFFELLDRCSGIGEHRPRLTVLDMGCGTGHLTATLVDRWGAGRAEVVGVDSSQDMLSKMPVRAGLSSVHSNMETFEPWRKPVDIIVSNAALQWVPQARLDALFAKWLRWLTGGGVFAFQVPGNFDSPSHALLADLRMSDKWRSRVGEGAQRHLAVSSPAEYVSQLYDLGFEHVDAWETTYAHVLPPSKDSVLEWVKGTGLTPVLARLNEEEAREFCAEYSDKLNVAYPVRPWGVVFPFRRIFVVARAPMMP